jgi:hypothetical protein
VKESCKLPIALVTRATILRVVSSSCYVSDVSRCCVYLAVADWSIVPKPKPEFDSYEDKEEEERINEEDDEDEELQRHEDQDHEEDDDLHSDDMRANPA